MNDSPELSAFLHRGQGACELYLIRHGDASPQEGDCVPGWCYATQGLSPRGHEQALALAQFMRSIELNAIYSSPLVRCRQTAQPLAQMLNMPVQPVDDVREIEHGADPTFEAPMSPSEFLAAFV